MVHKAFEQVVEARIHKSFRFARGGLLSAGSGDRASIFRPDPRMATPYSQQASAGVEYLLAQNLTYAATTCSFMDLKLPRTVNINLLARRPHACKCSELGVPNPTPQQSGGTCLRQFEQIPQFTTSINSEFATSTTMAAH